MRVMINFIDLKMTLHSSFTIIIYLHNLGKKFKAFSVRLIHMVSDTIIIIFLHLLNSTRLLPTFCSHNALCKHEAEEETNFSWQKMSDDFIVCKIAFTYSMNLHKMYWDENIICTLSKDVYHYFLWKQIHDHIKTFRAYLNVSSSFIFLIYIFDILFYKELAVGKY